LAQKKSIKQKSRSVKAPAKKIRPKAAPRMSRKNTAAKGKKPMPKARTKVTKRPPKSAVGSKGPALRARGKTKTKSEKPVSKAEATTAAIAPAHLLHQTKTTSAALSLLGKGVELIFQKDFKKAKNELKSLLQLYPGELDILARARSYIQICEREEANLKKPAASADQLYALGILEHNKANYDLAISYFLQSLAKHPNADYIYYSIAASHAKNGEVAKAIENLRKAVELNEDSRIYAKNDGDFSAIQAETEFAEIVGIVLPSSADSK
jgi:tetratricopeptide (TPR) repeat protein